MNRPCLKPRIRHGQIANKWRSPSMKITITANTINARRIDHVL